MQTFTTLITLNDCRYQATVHPLTKLPAFTDLERRSDIQLY